MYSTSTLVFVLVSNRYMFHAYAKFSIYETTTQSYELIQFKPTVCQCDTIVTKKLMEIIIAYCQSSQRQLYYTRFALCKE